MYAPLAPEHYIIPDATHCIFRLMQSQGDAQAWNLYWISHPCTDAMIEDKSNWFHRYRSLSAEETEAFYLALDTVVLGRLTLATIVSHEPMEARRLLGEAHLARTAFYHLFGGEAWRQTMLGRLFLATRRSNESAFTPTRDAEVIWIDFVRRNVPRKTAGA